jgi:hypothetical protein
MPARAFNNNSQGTQQVNSGNKPAVVQTAAIAPVKAPVINETKELHASIASQQEFSKSIKTIVTHEDRARFYTGHERIDLQSNQVKRVRELQEENDNLQREITIKENDVVDCKDPLALLADIEHRKIMVARNTGEILKIYAKNEERIKRISELEAQNNKLQKDMMGVQGKFISTNDMEERTKCASEFFILKSAIENNLKEIEELSKN